MERNRWSGEADEFEFFDGTVTTEDLTDEAQRKRNTEAQQALVKARAEATRSSDEGQDGPADTQDRQD